MKLINGSWRCNLCGCGGLRCTCLGGDMWICLDCEFQTKNDSDEVCRGCGSDRLVDRETRNPKKKLEIAKQNEAREAKAMNELYAELLQYRRNNNIYEVGDQYVMLKIDHQDFLTVEDGEMDKPWWNTRIIRHITDAERKVGHRL